MYPPYDTIEIKFKEKGQRIRWEDLPVIYTFSLNCQPLCCYQIAICKQYPISCQMAKVMQDVKRLYQMIEIRWNYEGSLQGHYIIGNVSSYFRFNEGT